MPGYWRITSSGGNFLLLDHTPNGATRTGLVVKVQVPEASALETLSVTDPVTNEYSTTNPWSHPVTIVPAGIASAGTTFTDGVYLFDVAFTISAVTYSFNEYHLYIPVIDACINTKLDTYLASSCVCKDTNQLQVLQELVVLRQGAHLDIEMERYTQATQKVTLMTNICTGTGCACICGC